MAPDSDLDKLRASGKFGSGFREFHFTEQGDRADVNLGLKVLLECANMLFDAETARVGFLSNAIAIASCSAMPTKGCCVMPTIWAALGATCGAR